MAVIGVLNQKGGVGKTTISVHLARAFSLNGEKTAVLDADPQGSASAWAAARQDGPLVEVVPANQSAMAGQVAQLQKQGNQIIIIDGPPGVSGMTAAIIKSADLLVIPIQPSPSDIWAVGDLVQLVQARQTVTGGAPKAVFAISRAVKGTVLTKTVESGLEGFELPIIETKLYQRVIFPEAWMEGATVMDVDNASQAAREVRHFAKEVRGMLA